MSPIKLGTRGSALALAQAHGVGRDLERLHPGLRVEIVPVKTKGDSLLSAAIWKIGDKGLFVKELENALLAKQIDLAVHSAKDLPAAIPDELCLAAFPPREETQDALVTASNLEWRDLPLEAVIGTSALRRRSQLLHHRPDLQIKTLRGNVDTRLQKLDEGQYFGIVAAKAGLNRLGINRGKPIPTEILLPSPGQGALALEVRKSDVKLLETVRRLEDPAAAVCVKAERSFLLKMEGGCQVPLGCLAAARGNTLQVQGFLGTPDGKKVIYEQIEGDAGEAEALGNRLAEKMLRRGGDILKAIEMTAQNG